jgi:hypothetical protein
MLKIIGLSVVLGFFAPALWAQDNSVRESASAIIEQNADDAVEQLVDLGASSVAAAAVVMEVVAAQSPRILPEVMLGLSAVMSMADFQAAANMAVAALGEAPGLRVAELSSKIAAGDSAVVYSRGQGRGEERRSETANNVEDGRGPPSGNPGRPPEQEPSLLRQILAPVFDLLGIDPPASPS